MVFPRPLIVCLVRFIVFSNILISNSNLRLYLNINECHPKDLLLDLLAIFFQGEAISRKRCSQFFIRQKMLTLDPLYLLINLLVTDIDFLSFGLLLGQLLVYYPVQDVLTKFKNHLALHQRRIVGRTYLLDIRHEGFL